MNLWLKKSKELKAAEDRAVGRKERQTIKEEVIFELMPRAFSRSSLQFAYIAPAEGMIVVNTASAKRAEDTLNYLRDSIGSVPVIPLTAKNTPQQIMTDWLKSGTPPKGFEFGHECELRDPSDEGGVIRCKHQELTASEITNHIEAGMYVSKLGLMWDGGIEFIVDEELGVKRISFNDIIEDKISQVDAQDAVEQFDVDFSIMTLEMSALIKALIAAFGGEQEAEDKAVDDSAQIG